MNLIIWLRELADNWNYLVRKMRHRTVSKIAQSVLTNLDIINAIEGAKQSARFEHENLLSVATFKTRKQLFEFAMDQVPGQGMRLEFGTYKGNSINQMAKIAPTRQFYAFDSFIGLPEGWTPGARRGSFTTKNKLPSVRSNVTIIPGMFEDSLSPFLQQHSGQQVDYVHVDCDLYSSTKTILDLLHSRFVVGSVVVFDEYYNYAEWLEGEYKAWMDFCTLNNIEFEYIGYIRMGNQVAVQITEIPNH